MKNPGHKTDNKERQIGHKHYNRHNFSLGIRE